MTMTIQALSAEMSAAFESAVSPDERREIPQAEGRRAGMDVDRMPEGTRQRPDAAR